MISRGFSQPGGMQTKKSTYSPSSYKPYTPPKPLTADELKLKIANAPTSIMVSQRDAKDALKMFYILLASAIISVIILVSVNTFVPHEYEVDFENVRKGKEKVKQKKTSNSWWWPMFIFYVILCFCCCYMLITWGTYKSETSDASYTQNVLLPKWQNQLQSLAPSAAAS
jgi:uncharacterized membrane protein